MISFWVWIKELLSVSVLWGRSIRAWHFSSFCLNLSWHLQWGEWWTQQNMSSKYNKCNETSAHAKCGGVGRYFSQLLCRQLEKLSKISSIECLPWFCASWRKMREQMQNTIPLKPAYPKPVCSLLPFTMSRARRENRFVCAFLGLWRETQSSEGRGRAEPKSCGWGMEGDPTRGVCGAGSPLGFPPRQPTEG